MLLNSVYSVFTGSLEYVDFLHPAAPLILLTIWFGLCLLLAWLRRLVFEIAVPRGFPFVDKGTLF